ncbi:hypothetical protein C8R44DRAFT_746195 [Mycena epipterygia]|nr:hypothetical protein C8R44DRAFT_746195 [Mycena epipterygia]
MPAKVMILAQFGHGYYIHGTLKRLMGVWTWFKAWRIRVSVKQVTDQKSMPCCLAREEMPAKVVILAQFGHGYYIRGTLKRLMGVLAWLKAWWIRVSVKQVADHCLGGEEMPAKVMILAQFGHGYYLHGTLKRLTDVVAYLKAWWIRAPVKQVTDQKSMPPLHHWRGNARKSRDFGSV